MLSNIHTNDLVLTANRRLAELIRQNYASQQQSQGRQVWETPQVMPLQTWLRLLWQNNPGEFDQLLTPFQEQQLWREIIQQNAHDRFPLLHLDNTTQLMQKAWESLNLWEIPLEALSKPLASTEVSFFINCAIEFLKRCGQQQWLSELQLPLHLLNHPISLPPKIILAGFDEIPPVYQTLFKVISQWCVVTKMDHQPTDAKLYRQVYTSIDSEILQIAQWAKARITENPRQSIGCVIPELNQHRAQVQRIFTQVFAPQNQLFGGQVSPVPFNISGGERLDRFEIINIALQVLVLNLRSINIESLGQLLQSAYLCQNENDIYLGAQLDAECRRLGKFELSQTDLFSAMAHWQNHYPHHTWLQRWRAFAALGNESHTIQAPSAWAAYFTKQLSALGWPGGRQLNSLEYQLVARFQELLLEFAELDKVSSLISRTEARSILHRLSQQTIFQPQSEAQAPIQILGVLETSGFYFDALWVMGLDDQHWPAAAEPNPFLPYSLQIQRQMPHASMQRELAYAQQITQRLLGSAPEIWLSCSPSTADQPVHFSRLIPEASADPTQQTFAISYAEKIFASARQEIIEDEQGPAVLPLEKIRGGSGILTQQAECPFRAFATFRLKAAPLEEPQLGISSRLHGTLIHCALELVWKTLKNQQNLLAIKEEKLQKLLIEITDHVLAEARLDSESPFTHIEKNRLISLLNEWLALEKQRPPFQVIEQETERTIDLSGIRLQLKIDRIDQLSNGAQLLIDYKTSLTRIYDWLDERLQQPQLPLYTLNHHQNLAGVAFAQLRVGELTFKGLHDETLDTQHYFPTGIISVDKHKEFDAPKTWPDLLAYWRTTLEQLAADFYHGNAKVDPAEKSTPCQRCDLQLLCRIQ
jgi:ATP-dependent helicase/nuclease subunit B